MERFIGSATFRYLQKSAVIQLTAARNREIPVWTSDRFGSVPAWCSVYFETLVYIQLVKILLWHWPCNLLDVTVHYQTTRFRIVWHHNIKESIRFFVFVLIYNLLKPTGHVMHQQFNIQQLYVLPTLYLCVLYLAENKQRLVPLIS